METGTEEQHYTDALTSTSTKPNRRLTLPSADSAIYKGGTEYTTLSPAAGITLSPEAISLRPGTRALLIFMSQHLH